MNIFIITDRNGEHFQGSMTIQNFKQVITEPKLIAIVEQLVVGQKIVGTIVGPTGETMTITVIRTMDQNITA